MSFPMESIQGTERPALKGKGLQWPRPALGCIHSFLRVVGYPTEPSREEGIPEASGLSRPE